MMRKALNEINTGKNGTRLNIRAEKEPLHLSLQKHKNLF